MSKRVEKPLMMECIAELVKSQLENRKPNIDIENIDYEAIIKIAIENQMIQMILGSLLKIDIPENWKEVIKPIVIKSSIKSLQQIHEAKKIQDELEKAKIKNQFLKGAVLRFIYPRPELREMSDIDFMVYDESFEVAKDILSANGYSLNNAEKHHYVYRKPPFLCMEMHWDLYEKTVDKGQYLYFKNDMKAHLKENFQYTYEFSKEDFYIYMIAHIAKHFYEQGCGIRNIVDVYVYKEKMQNELNWSIVQSELEKCGLSDFELHISNLAKIWLGEQNSTVFYNSMFMYMLNCGIYGKAENGIWAQLVKQSSNQKISSNGKFLKVRYCFPPYEYMKEYYPWMKKCRLLLPVAWLVRGIHGISSKDSKERVRQLTGDNVQVYEIQDIYNKLNLRFAKN